MLLNLYKKRGETPLQTIERYKEENPQFRNESMTYAGRLDPIAEGVLPVLTGEDVHRKEEFTGKDKEYIAEVLFSFITDTYDILGLAEKTYTSEISESEIKEALLEIQKREIFSYPPYSSKTYKGKPLWKWARDGGLEKLPEREMNLISWDKLSLENRGSEDLLAYINETVSLVSGDFRQEEVLKNWEDLLVGEGSYQILRVNFEVSSGTYIRTLAHELGTLLGSGALILSLKRSRVGDICID